MLPKNTMTRWTTTAILIASFSLLASEAQGTDVVRSSDLASFGSGLGHSNQGTLARPEHSNQGGDNPDPNGDPPKELNFKPIRLMQAGDQHGVYIADAADLWVTDGSSLSGGSDELAPGPSAAFGAFDYRSTPSVAVPEPSSLMLIALGLGCLVRRRR